MCLEDKGYHPPFAGDLFSTKLLRVPLLGTICRCAQIGDNEPQSTHEGAVDDVTLWRGYHGKAQIDQAFASVMRADEIPKKTLLWQCILLEAGQVFVAFMLVRPSVEVRDGPSDDSSRQKALQIRSCFLPQGRWER